jgi:hypothetical protein
MCPRVLAAKLRQHRARTAPAAVPTLGGLCHNRRLGCLLPLINLATLSWSWLVVSLMLRRLGQPQLIICIETLGCRRCFFPRTLLVQEMSETKTQITRFGEVQVGRTPNGTDLARSAALLPEARAILRMVPVVDAQTGNFAPEYHDRPAISAQPGVDVDATLHRVNVLRRNAVAAHNVIAEALDIVLERMLAKRPDAVTAGDRALLDEMHALKGAAHRDALKAKGMGAAAGNLYNRVRHHCHTRHAHTHTREKKRKKN